MMKSYSQRLKLLVAKLERFVTSGVTKKTKKTVIDLIWKIEVLENVIKRLTNKITSYGVTHVFNLRARDKTFVGLGVERRTIKGVARRFLSLILYLPYEAKNEIKAAGGRWDAASSGWYFLLSEESDARKVLNLNCVRQFTTAIAVDYSITDSDTNARLYVNGLIQLMN